ncbi:MAG: lactate racemase domain-containing protein, partial [Bryobacteraceae bacterium]
MQVKLAFGKKGLEVNLQEGLSYQVLEARSAQPLPDARGAIERALDEPVAGPALAELARGRRSAAISVCDITRPAPSPLVLPPLLERLERAGIARS